MLQSVQHLFLSTESPSPPWGETKTQTKKEVREPTKHRHGGRREANPGCHAKATLSQGFPFLASPRLAPARPQPCSAWGCLQAPHTRAPRATTFMHALGAHPAASCSPRPGGSSHAPASQPPASAFIPVPWLHHPNLVLALPSDTTLLSETPKQWGGRRGAALSAGGRSR